MPITLPHRARILILALLMPAAAARGEAWFNTPLSPRIASYAITVTLDDQRKTLSGRETLLWRNTSPDRVGELQFHLYLNAFKNSRTTLMRDWSAPRIDAVRRGGWGWIDITSMRLSTGEDLTPGIGTIQPDDGNPFDQTVLRVSLPRPVEPGGRITLTIDFSAKLPPIVRRTGYHGQYYLIAQWFPKIGVYEAAGQRGAAAGGWNCHQFHSNTEFFADFGVYDVSVTIPSPFIIGATGTLSGKEENPDGTTTWQYHAEDVHDFTWTASPHYQEVTDRWKHVGLRVLMQPQRTHQASRYLHGLKGALEYLDAHVGPYPYPIITVVDPAWNAAEAGGMEYPTLITAGSLWGIGPWLRGAELVTVHEFTHQYWYGMSNNNQVEEAWLDEGLTQYYETRIMDDLYGARRSVLDLPGLTVGDLEMTRAGYTSMANPRVAAPATFAWKFPPGSYGVLTYNKTATVLATLERMLGTTTMDSVMRTFFRRWRFRQPGGRDLIRTFNEVVRAMHGSRYGANLDWYFDQVLYGAGVCDYEVTSITTRRAVPPDGFIDSAGTKVLRAAATPDTALIESRVTVARLGEVRIPVTVRIGFEDGKVVDERWDAAATTHVLIHRGPSRVRWASVDPEHAVLLDVNFNNNSLTLAPPRSGIWKVTAGFLFWVQNILHTLSLIG